MSVLPFSRFRCLLCNWSSNDPVSAYEHVCPGRRHPAAPSLSHPTSHPEGRRGMTPMRLVACCALGLAFWALIVFLIALASS